jgi:hypothetical protein
MARQLLDDPSVGIETEDVADLISNDIVTETSGSSDLVSTLESILGDDGVGSILGGTPGGSIIPKFVVSQ